MSQFTVQDFAQFLKNAKEDNKPYVLFTGAGCSYTAGIPLAGELVEEINRDFSFALKNLTETEKKQYGKCMAALGKDNRRRLLSKYIDKAKINWASLMIAQLIDRGYFKRVLTFNFDNLLARSCGLLGLYPATYDLTSADVDLHNLIVEPAIVHLHGQSHGFTQLNSDDETAKQTGTLSNFITTTLNSSPALFIGYSGDADAFFPELCTRYNGQHHLFWSGRDEEPKSTVNNQLLKHHSTAHYLQAKDADRFFIELAKALDVFPPKVIENPHAHLFAELENIKPMPVGSDDSSKDILTNTKQELTELIETKAQNKNIDTDKLLLEEKYQQLIDLYENKEIEQLNDNDKNNIAWAYTQLGVEQAKLMINATDRQIAENHYQQVAHNYQHALNIQPYMHEVLYNWGNAFSDLAEKAESPNIAKTLYKQACEKYQQALTIKPDDHETLNNWGVALSDLAKQADSPENANVLLEQACEKYQQAISIKPDYHAALNNWGLTLSNLAEQADSPENANVLLEQACEKYQQALTIKPDKHEALNNWGSALGNLAQQADNSEQSIALFEQAVEKYQQAISIKPDYHAALNNWGLTLSNLAQQADSPENANVLLEQACEKYQQALTLKTDKHEVLDNWGSALGNLAQQADNSEQSIALFEQAVEKYQQAISIKPDFHNALNNWGNALSNLAKQADNPEQAERYLQEAKDALLTAEKIEPNNVYNLACCYSLTKQTDECKQKLLTCLSANTLPNKQHLTEDPDLDNVRHLDWFSELLEKAS
nr:photosystem I assembly protein Ycf3 [uncultured bacterium]